MPINASVSNFSVHKLKVLNAACFPILECLLHWMFFISISDVRIQAA